MCRYHACSLCVYLSCDGAHDGVGVDEVGHEWAQPVQRQHLRQRRHLTNTTRQTTHTSDSSWAHVLRRRGGERGKEALGVRDAHEPRPAMSKDRGGLSAAWQVFEASRAPGTASHLECRLLECGRVEPCHVVQKHGNQSIAGLMRAGTHAACVAPVLVSDPLGCHPDLCLRTSPRTYPGASSG